MLLATTVTMVYVEELGFSLGLYSLWGPEGKVVPKPSSFHASPLKPSRENIAKVPRCYSC